jgi:hypothetical protein
MTLPVCRVTWSQKPFIFRRFWWNLGFFRLFAPFCRRIEFICRFRLPFNGKKCQEKNNKWLAAKDEITDKNGHI